MEEFGGPKNVVVKDRQKRENIAFGEKWTPPRDVRGTESRARGGNEWKRLDRRREKSWIPVKIRGPGLDRGDEELNKQTGG